MISPRVNDVIYWNGVHSTRVPHNGEGCLRRGTPPEGCWATSIRGMSESTPAATYAHLKSIDAAAWPGVAAVPQPGRFRTRRAEASFARACAAAGIELEGDNAGVTVERAEVFQRIAAGGWVGFAESYMAGEWTTPGSQQLVDVLTALLRTGYHPRTQRVDAPRPATAGDLPPELVAHFSGDGMSAFQGHFATGVATTERAQLKSHTKGAGCGSEPAHHFVDVTEFSAPLESDRDDLADAQRRSMDMLLDGIGASSGTYMLEYPSSGGALAFTAASRGATVDAVSRDARMYAAMRERLILSGTDGSVTMDRVAEGPQALAQQRHGVYDAVASMEALETMPPRQQRQYLRAVDGLLASGGRAGLQAIMRTDKYTRAADLAAESLRAYIWPGLHFASAEEIAKTVDRETDLRVVAQTAAPEHLAASLRLQRITFDGKLRDAAADGYDVVFRRLWTWQFALREAMARLGMIDLAQITLARRNRRGRR